MKHLNKAFTLKNLRKSWQYLNTSSKYDYKNYFRNHYKAYGLSIDDNLKDLQTRLKRRIYSPSHAIKLYIPKKSGILRPFTLLSIEDQIVYQALVTIISEKYYPNALKNYNAINFGNQLTGNRSKFFFQDWKEGYTRYNTEIRRSFDNGLKATAIFDLTAFYDSIDHKVLKYFLKNLGFQNDFIEILTNHLECWTCNADNIERIYHGHGIPQGPMASGILAEVVLSFVDEEFKKHNNPLSDPAKYLRYVDDIRVMAIDESGIKNALLSLDLISKRIGLFPQPSKINPHIIQHIAEEIKSVSFDPEIRDNTQPLEAKTVILKINKNTKKNQILNETEFKYTIARAPLSKELSKKLIKILDKQPHLYDPILRYFERFENLPLIVSNTLLHSMKMNKLYEEVTAKYLRCCLSRVHKSCETGFKDFCLNELKRFEAIKSSNLKSAILSWLFYDLNFSYLDLEKLLDKSDEWIKQNIIHAIKKEHYGVPTYQELLNGFLTDKNNEVALNAAYLCIKEELKITVASSNINPLAQIPLYKLGKIKTRSARVSSIHSTLENILEYNFLECNWKKFLGVNHNKAEEQIFMCKTYIQNDPSAFVLQVDVFNEFVLHSLYTSDTTLGTYQLGNIGGFVNRPTGNLAKKYPNIYLMCTEMHNLRYKNHLAHPKNKQTKKYTERIRFSELQRRKKILVNGYKELINTINVLIPVPVTTT